MKTETSLDDLTEKCMDFEMLQMVGSKIGKNFEVPATTKQESPTQHYSTMRNEARVEPLMATTFTYLDVNRTSMT